jgi:hypothetical protein
MNREMLKECIADAKTIRESAIANAKLALEEAFTPQLTAMFAERLNELELEESEATKKPVDEYSMEEEQITVDENFNLEELLAELEMEEGQDPTMEGEDMYEEQLEEDLMLEEMSDEEIEELVMKTIEDMIASGKLMAGEESEDEDMDDMEDMEDMGDMEDMEGEEEEEDEDINLEELLAEMDSVEETEEVKEGLFDKIKSFFGSVLTNFENENKDVITKYENSKKTKEDKIEFIDALNNWGRKNQIEGPFLQAARTAASEKYKLGLSPGGTTASMGTFEEAKEMEETINELRNELNEVNLLNAKLLYTNKIFKAKNLTESEKIKVLNTFDKAETVKEVKLVFETLTESFKATTAKKNPIKESLGSASKTISTATPKQPIIESNEAFARMQRLAGLKK